MSNNLPAREMVRDAMSDEFDKSGKVEWTVAEISRALKGVLDRKDLYSALQALKLAGKAEQTTAIPGGRGGAKYWALTKCLELATNPETAPKTTPDGNADADAGTFDESAETGPHVNGIAAEPITTEKEVTSMTDTDRKPRHDSPEYVVNKTQEFLTEMQTNFFREVSTMLRDSEKVIKARVDSIADRVHGEKQPASPSIPVELLDGLKVLADIGERFDAFMVEDGEYSVKLVGHLRELYSRLGILGDLIGKTFEEVNDADTTYRKAYGAGFGDGWACAEQRMRDEINANARGFFKKMGGEDAVLELLARGEKLETRNVGQPPEVKITGVPDEPSGNAKSNASGNDPVADMVAKLTNRNL